MRPHSVGASATVLHSGLNSESFFQLTRSDRSVMLDFRASFYVETRGVVK